jgi:hypothetical protein
MKKPLLTLINNYLPATSEPLPESLPEADIEEAIRQRVKFLLDQDMERLLHLLYRVDVPESRVKEILAVSMPGQIDKDITDLIITRLKQKIETRKKYGQS